MNEKLAKAFYDVKKEIGLDYIAPGFRFILEEIHFMVDEEIHFMVEL